MATNITAPVHHLPVHVCGVHQVTRCGRHFFTQVLYAASVSAQFGDVLPVDYAEMQTVVWRQAAA